MDIICGPKLSNKKKRKITRNKESIYCPICKEKYDDPPTEDWIQCSTCKKWFHEECTAYVGGAFTCDFCDGSQSANYQFPNTLYLTDLLKAIIS